ncbi:MAG: replication-associated recombination protein A, partial [Paludibacteraceae bacterium]|nr:replication-associated recombination protein A [Paludibacteraceae bacterium]
YGKHYKYPHDYPNHYVEQQYLPDALKGRTFWKAQDNDSETRIMNGLNARKKR